MEPGQIASFKGWPPLETPSTPTAQANNRPPPEIPDHELLRCIGRGSYGAVWLARNMFGVYRAVKIVFRASFTDQHPFDRELKGIRKFEPVSRSHEGVVCVLQVGNNKAQGYFYYVMELGDDQALGQQIDPERYSPKTLGKEITLHGRLPFQRCLELGLALSQALAELHKNGLVHRDIKPSNIIFVNGVPKLADIGLVASIDEPVSWVGTPGFIPPQGPGSVQADVYSLGKVLYEASTGKDRQDFPALPAEWDQSPDHERLRELNEVLLKACENDSNKRYQSVWHMHADLVALANGKSLRRLNTLERRQARLRRVALLISLALAVLGPISYQVYRERKGVLESRQRQVGASLAYGNRAMGSGDVLAALPYFADALRLDDGDRDRERMHRLRLGSVLAQCPKLTHLWFADKQVNHGAFSPDGKSVLIAEHYGQVKFYNLHSGEPTSHSLTHRSGLRSAAYSPRGKFVVATYCGGDACIWDAVSLKEVCALPHSNHVACARFSQDEHLLVTACYDGLARVWDIRAGQKNPLLLTLKHRNAVLFSDVSQDGLLNVTASADNTAQLWRTTDGQPVGTPLEHKSWVSWIAFSPDGQKVITACLDHKARVWEVKTGRRILPDLNHRDGVQSAEFSPDGSLIVTASLDGTVRLWRADTLEPANPNPILRHSDRVTHASFCPEGRRIISTCTDGSVRIWDLAGSAVPPLTAPGSVSQDGTCFLTITNNGMVVCDALSGEAASPFIPLKLSLESAKLNHNSRFVVSISRTQTRSDQTNRVLQVWDVAGGKLVGAGISVSNSVFCASLSDDGTRLVTFGGKIAQTWNVAAGEALSSPLPHDGTVRSAFLNRDGNRTVTISGNKVQVWHTTTGRVAFGPLKHPVPVSYAAFSPDGTHLVTCCSDNQFTRCFAQVWDANTGTPVGSQLNHGDGVLFASFSRDGGRVVTASEDFTAIVWDAVTGKQLTPALKHDNQVQTAVFSPDGRWIVTASSDRTARVWSAETGDPLTPPLRHLASLLNGRFLADGRCVVTFDSQGKTCLWRLPMDERPAKDALLLARFLSVDNVVAPGSSTQSLQTIFQQLRRKYPSDFTTTDQEIGAWHEFRAEESELQQQWFAAAFHLQRLLALRPGDQSLIRRLARATERTQNTGGS